MPRLVAIILSLLAATFLTVPGCSPPRVIHHPDFAAPEDEVPVEAPASGTVSATPPTEPGLLLAQINAMRTASGVSTVMSNAAAAGAAQSYAAFMAASGVAAHGLDGKTSRERLEAVGIKPPPSGLSQIVQEAGNNLTMAMVLNSPGYKSVVQTAKWTQVGIGYAIGGGKGYWCVIFFV